MSPISSKNKVPPCAWVNSPRVLLTAPVNAPFRSEEHTSELQSHVNLVCRLLLEKKKKKKTLSVHTITQEEHRTTTALNGRLEQAGEAAAHELGGLRPEAYRNALALVLQRHPTRP